MTTYEVDSEHGTHQLLASWPDLPERASHRVAVFQEQKLASVARSVLNAASRYRWRRFIQLLDAGVYPGQAASEPMGPPVLATSAVLGEVPMGPELQGRIEELVPAPGQAPEPARVDQGGFTERVRVGNLGPLLWRDWYRHLSAEEREALSAELDADLAATTGRFVERARQAAWYLSAEMLIDEDHSRLATAGKAEEDDEGAKAFQKSLLGLLSDLIGLRAESTAVDWDPDNEELLRVYSPVSVVGFWLDPECWYYGWPDPDSPAGQPTLWQHAGTLATDTSIGDLAAHIHERTNRGTWPFGGSAPNARRTLFGGRR
ncbi:MAG: hypothetical protein ABSD85_00690 [Acidimicrobiales bacterium]|jgi:hypothetical protein